MPSLSDVLTGSLDLSRYSPASTSNDSPHVGSPSTDMEPGRSSFMRCPLPPLWQASPDALRQFYIGGRVPQQRLLTPLQPITAGTSSSSSTTTGSSSASGSSSSSSSGGSSTITATQVVLTTNTLGPGSTFSSRITISRSFQLLSVGATGACRIEVYGTSATQAQDLTRALDIAPPAGTTQNIICDVALDSSPYTWTFQNRIGANADNPQTTLAYVTITNLGAGSAPISVTFRYVPLES